MLRLGGLAVLALALPSCRSAVTERRAIQFSGGQIELVRTSIGSALGEERIELIHENNGDRRTFFEGANFSEFNVSERSGKLHIQMCRGFIEKAEPILLGNPEATFRLVRLDLDWNCRDKSQETS